MIYSLRYRGWKWNLCAWLMLSLLDMTWCFSPVSYRSFWCNDVGGIFIVRVKFRLRTENKWKAFKFPHKFSLTDDMIPATRISLPSHPTIAKNSCWLILILHNHQSKANRYFLAIALNSSQFTKIFSFLFSKLCEIQ